MRVCIARSDAGHTMSYSCLMLHVNAQVVNLSALSPIQLQKVYVKFTKELYILSKLQHPRIVTVYGCATTVEELTLVMEVSIVTYI
jgi:Protein tyrosine and serine/threonine kinase